MHFKRLVISALSAIILMTLLATGSAQAADSSNHHAGNHVLIAPAAPLDAKSTSAQFAAAVSPTISPAVATAWVQPNGVYVCNVGNLCPIVWDPTIGRWKVFYLYDCRFYSVSNWNGGGYFYDNQTGGVTSTFYDQYQRPLISFTVDGIQHSYPWDPVWYIQNC